MIKRFTDHSANERTYLAWIRTAIAIMAFGFLIEKFDLFVSYIGKTIGDEQNLHRSIEAEVVGLGLFIVGILLIIAATIRFFINRQAIDAEEEISFGIRKTNYIFSGLVILLALFLLFYMAHKLVL
jgi:putative membrane protein